MSTNNPPTFELPPNPPAVLPLSAEKYIDHLDDCDMTEAQKTEFLRTLWTIMATFVRLGFGVESVLPAVFHQASAPAADGLEETIPTHEFNVAASEAAPEKED